MALSTCIQITSITDGGDCQYNTAVSTTTSITAAAAAATTTSAAAENKNKCPVDHDNYGKYAFLISSNCFVFTWYVFPISWFRITEMNLLQIINRPSL